MVVFVALGRRAGVRPSRRYREEIRRIGGPTVFGRARSAIDKLEDKFEDFVFSRDPHLGASLEEADARLAAGQTQSLDEFCAALDAPADRPLAR